MFRLFLKQSLTCCPQIRQAGSLWRGYIKNVVFRHINDYDIQPSPQDRLNMSAEETRTYIADRVAAILKDEGFLHFGKNATNVCHSLSYSKNVWSGYVVF
jgi:hypothetical protein